MSSEQHGYRPEGNRTGDQGAGFKGSRSIPVFSKTPELRRIDAALQAHGGIRSAHPDPSDAKLKSTDYPTETVSYHQIFSIFGWPYDTTTAMTRLVFAASLKNFLP